MMRRVIRDIKSPHICTIWTCSGTEAIREVKPPRIYTIWLCSGIHQRNQIPKYLYDLDMQWHCDESSRIKPPHINTTVTCSGIHQRDLTPTQLYDFDMHTVAFNDVQASEPDLPPYQS